MKVLIIDDDPDVRFATSRAVRKAGYDVLEAATAAECLAAVRRHRPDVLLLDVVLPDGDGRALCRRIKDDAGLAATCVVLISGLQTSGSAQAAGLDSGADAFIARPVSNRELVARLNAVARTCKSVRQLSDDLASQKAFYQLLAENATDMVSKHDLQGMFNYASPSAAELIGYRPDELIGRSAYDLFCNADLPAIQASHQTVLQHTATYPVSYRIRHKEGHFLWVETVSKTIRDPASGAPLEIICTTRDITARKAAERELRDTMANLQALLNAPPETALLVDRGMHILAVNQTGARRLNRSAESLIGVYAPSLFPPALADARKREFQKVLQDGRPRRVVDRRAGMVLENHLYPVLDEAGKVVRVAVFSQDITEKQGLLAAQRQKTAELEEANTTLRVLVKNSEAERSKIERDVLENVRELVLPYLQRLRQDRLTQQQTSLLNVAVQNLEDITAPMAAKWASPGMELTPALTQVADLIKKGFSSRDIAAVLGLSEASVSSYRKRIRQRLGLQNSRVNLRAFLMAAD